MIPPLCPKTYRYPCFIPFHLSDPGGILFFSHVFTLFHQAFEQFVTAQLGCSWNEWFHHPEWIVPIKHAEANYHFPLHAGKECMIMLSIPHISTCSFTVCSHFSQSEHCCTLNTTHVFCDRNTKTKRIIPSPLCLSLKAVMNEKAVWK